VGLWTCLFLILALILGTFFDEPFIIFSGIFGLSFYVGYLVLWKVPFYLQLPLAFLVNGGYASILAVSCMLEMS